MKFILLLLLYSGNNLLEVILSFIRVFQTFIGFVLIALIAVYSIRLFKRQKKGQAISTVWYNKRHYRYNLLSISNIVTMHKFYLSILKQEIEGLEEHFNNSQFLAYDKLYSFIRIDLLKNLFLKLIEYDHCKDGLIKILTEYITTIDNFHNESDYRSLYNIKNDNLAISINSFITNLLNRVQVIQDLRTSLEEVVNKEFQEYNITSSEYLLSAINKFDKRIKREEILKSLMHFPKEQIMHILKLVSSKGVKAKNINLKETKGIHPDDLKFKIILDDINERNKIFNKMMEGEFGIRTGTDIQEEQIDKKKRKSKGKLN